jgi:hypothetical protein
MMMMGQTEAPPRFEKHSSFHSLRCRNHFNSLNSSSFLSQLISSPCPSHITHAQPKMDTAIDLSDASKALDLANIRFQLMYTHPTRLNKTCKRQTR